MTLPKEFEEYTRNLMGDDLYDILRHGLEEQVPTSIRINPFKILDRKTPSAGNSKTSELKQDSIPWCKYGFYLKDRPAFTFDPLLHAGAYYVQEASSMFVCEVVSQLFYKPVMMLDLCAAPGGKSTALRSVLPKGSLLFSNEPIKSRASILKENIVKFGHPGVIVTNNYPRDYNKSGLSFDAILADVPCSGEGMFRKDPKAISEWSLTNVEKCWQLQRSIIEDIWTCLKPGGILIYSTCTFNAHEDEENISWIADSLGADILSIDVNPDWNITGNLLHSNDNQQRDFPVYRFIPGKTKGEGLFLAILRKYGDNAESIGKYIPTLISSEDKDKLFVLPSSFLPIYNKVKSKLHIIHAGITIGMKKGKTVIPDVSLALSTAKDIENFPNVELTYDEAIRFLRREAVNLPTETPRGYVTVSYHGYTLGFEKNIGNRANNLYPQEWRIKSTHITDVSTSPLEELMK